MQIADLSQVTLKLPSIPTHSALELAYAILVHADDSDANFQSVYTMLEMYTHYEGATQPRFITLAIEQYLSRTSRCARNYIMGFLAAVFDTRPELLPPTFMTHVVPLYINDTRYFLTRNMLNNPDRITNFVSSMSRFTIDILNTYVQGFPFTPETVATYSDMFTILSNLSYVDIVPIGMVELGMTLFHQYPNLHQFQYDIIHFLRNVFFDDVAHTFFEDIGEFGFLRNYIVPFAVRCHDAIPLMVIEILDSFVTELLDEELFTPEIVDLVMNVAAKGDEELEEAVRFLRRLASHLMGDSGDLESTAALIDHIVTHPTLTRHVETAILHSQHDEACLWVHLLSSLTAASHTEVPCRVFYTTAFAPLVGEPQHASRVLFALCNIISTRENMSFVDMDTVFDYTLRMLGQYVTDDWLYKDLHYMFLKFSQLGVLHNLLARPNVVELLHAWLANVAHTGAYARYVYKSIMLVFRAISQHDDLQHMFESELGFAVHRIARFTSPNVYMENAVSYMNCTLQQKCAVALYNANKVNWEDLAALDVKIYVV